MSLHLQRDVEKLKKEILKLGTMVETAINNSILALNNREMAYVDEVLKNEEFINEMEVKIEEDCLKILALHQPVAGDLRFIVVALKVNNDLERIADLAVNIAQRGRSVGDYPEFDIPDKLENMVTQATQMLRQALDAFVTLDTQQARRVIQMDNEVDQLNVEIIDELREVMKEHSHLVVPALHCFSAVRHLERIGDLATNIAEDVIYLTQGDIVRHQQRAAKWAQ